MASVRKRGKNSWQLTVELGYNAQGKRVQERKTIVVEDPALLRAPKRLENYLDMELKKFQMECEAGTYMKVDKMTFESFVEKWTSSFVNVELEEKTKENYAFQMKKRILPYFGHLRMEQIKTMHINDFMESLRKPEARLDGQAKPLGSATLVYNYRVLRSLFTKAVDWKVIKTNPMLGVNKPKEDDKREMEYYNEKEIAALFAALSNEPLQLRVLITLAVTTGLRRGELAGLEWKCIDLEAGTLEVKKTIPKLLNGEPVVKGPKNKKSARKIALSPSVIEELKAFHKEWRKERMQIEDKWEDGKYEYLFCHPNGKPLDPQRLSKYWIAFHRNHNLKSIRLHDLRHTNISWMIFKKVHSEAIAKRAGHTNTKMIEIYGHVFESVDKAAAAVFDDMMKPTKTSKKKA